MLERAQQRPGEDQLATARVARSLALEVDDLDTRQRSPRDPAGQHESFELAALGGVTRLERGRRAAEDERAAGAFGAQPRQAARVVAEALVVLVGGVVLLVDHDDAKVVERGEQCAARANCDRDLAARESPPLLEPFAGLEAAVQDGDAVAKARAQPRHDLMGERDLGH